MDRVLELVTFRTVPGTDEAAFLTQVGEMRL